jgi:arylsulfatase A-like enzyme
VVTSQAEHAYLLEAESVRTGRYQLISTQAQLSNRLRPLELYDLQEDPGQKKNLAYERPATTLHLQRMARQVRAEEKDRREAPKAPGKDVEESLRGLQYLR